MNNWYEREMELLCEAVNNGEISQAEYDSAVRDLTWELREQAAWKAGSLYISGGIGL